LATGCTPDLGLAPDNTDTLMVVVGIILVGAVLMVGNLYLRLQLRVQAPLLPVKTLVMSRH
jgi:hypothetical protein